MGSLRSLSQSEQELSLTARGVSRADKILDSKIADHVAKSAPKGRSILIDAFCGAGGNTIAFAKSGHWRRVYAIEKDPATLECAKENARIYGVHDKITWFVGDCFELLGDDDSDSGKAVDVLKIVAGEYGVIFASPPWGGKLTTPLFILLFSRKPPRLTRWKGPAYKTQKVFDLNSMPYSLQHMVESFSKLTKNLLFYLPRTSDLRQIAECLKEDEKAQVVHYCTNGASRALCTYLGDWETVVVAPGSRSHKDESREDPAATFAGKW